jgi:hypothetical protein
MLTANLLISPHMTSVEFGPIAHMAEEEPSLEQRVQQQLVDLCSKYIEEYIAKSPPVYFQDNDDALREFLEFSLKKRRAEK